MPLKDFITDPDARTLTVVAEYPVPIETLWDRSMPSSTPPPLRRGSVSNGLVATGRG